MRERRGTGARRSQCSFRTSVPEVKDGCRDLPRSCDQAGQALGQSAVDAIIDQDEQTLHLAEEPLGFESLAFEPASLFLMQRKP